ncbi:MAG: hypothetical protein ABIP68_07365 [Ferruginibacter sp.]
MLGPNVTITTGDHNTSEFCSYMYNVFEKLTENDLPKIIEDYFWIGAGSIILKCVTSRSGFIKIACFLVIENVSPLSIVGGVHVNIFKMRFSAEDLIEHKNFKSHVHIISNI